MQTGGISDMDSRLGQTGEQAGNLQLEWRDPSGMAGLSFKILLFKILTLGLYHFWGKTEVRRRLWNGIRLNGQPFEYTGTGKELFLGFLIAMVILFIPSILYVVAMTFLFGPESGALDLALIPLYLVFFFLMGVAVYRAMRYRLRRTHWRGIRGTLVGSPWRYGWTSFWTALTMPLTLGWSYPWRTVKLARMMTQDMRFGDRAFSLDAHWKPLLLPFALAWFSIMAFLASLAALPFTSIAIPLAIVLFGVMVYFGLRYRAWEMNYLTDQMRFDGARFSLQATPGSLFSLFVTNFLIVVLSFGILAPVAVMRMFRYMVTRMRLDGHVDFSSIAQAQDRVGKTGEGLLEALDIDSF